MFCCGEVLPRPAAEKFLSRFPGAALLNAYGPTEAACAVCAVNAADALATFADGPLPVGLVEQAAVEIAALGPKGELLAEGEPASWPCGARAYFPATCPAAATPGFPAGWYRTGDSGFVKVGHVWWHRSGWTTS